MSSIEIHKPGENQLEAGHAVVHVEGGVAGVFGLQGVNVDIVVQDGPQNHREKYQTVLPLETIQCLESRAP